MTSATITTIGSFLSTAGAELSVHSYRCSDGAAGVTLDLADSRLALSRQQTDALIVLLEKAKDDAWPEPRSDESWMGRPLEELTRGELIQALTKLGRVHGDLIARRRPAPRRLWSTR